MRDACARRIKIDAVFGGELLDLSVFLQILRRDILNVVINREDRLRRIGNRGRADLLELRDNRAGVVMRHDMARTNRNEITGSHHRSRGETISVPRGNLLNERETHNPSEKVTSWRRACQAAWRYRSPRNRRDGK